MIIALIAIIWAVCGVFAYGLALSEFTNKFPYFNHRFISITMAIFGPFGLLTALTLSNSLHLKFKPLSVDERFAIFCDTYAYSATNNLPGFTREDFNRKYA